MAEIALWYVSDGLVRQACLPGDRGATREAQVKGRPWRPCSLCVGPGPLIRSCCERT